MKKILVAFSAAAAFACLPSFAVAAPADDPQLGAAVKAVLDAMEVRKMMAASFSEMEKQMPAMMRAEIQGVIQADTTLSDEQKKEAQARVEKMIPDIVQAVHRMLADPTLIDDILKEIEPLYARSFTVAELKELAAFYQTPLGRKLLVTAPKLGAEGMAIGQRAALPRIGKLMQDIMQNVQKQ